MKNPRSLRILALAMAAVIGVPALAAVSSPEAAVAVLPADTITRDQALRVVAQYPHVFTTPPTRTAQRSPDGPRLGNGNIGVSFSGTGDLLTAAIGQNSFWSPKADGAQLANQNVQVGQMTMSTPGLAGASYQMVQDIAKAEVRGTFTLGAQTLDTTSWVSATDTALVTQLKLTGGAAQDFTLSFKTNRAVAPTDPPVISGDMMSQDFRAVPSSTAVMARISTRILGVTPTFSGSSMTVTLQPGTVYTVVSAVVNNVDSASWQSVAADKAAALTEASVATLNTAHRAWWNDFWAKSFVEIADKVVERAWYSAVYIMGSASRAGEVAPGLWGPWTTPGGPWADYHLNYNYEVPALGMVTTNHVEQADNYADPLIDYIEAGRTLAASYTDGGGKTGFEGILLPVAISPAGKSPYVNVTHGQKSNAAFAAAPMINQYLTTYDAAYAAKIYPYLKEVLAFWEDDLRWDAANNRWTILWDAQTEGASTAAVNTMTALAFLKYTLQGAIKISADLGVDADKRAEWQTTYLDKLSALPTMQRLGKTVFSVLENSPGTFYSDNEIGAYQIYPADQIGLNSDPTQLQIALDTVTQKTGAWHHGNAKSTHYVVAARVGYDPARILSEMRAEALTAFPNGVLHHDYGGLEYTNLVGSGLPEMMLQSFQNDIKVFKSWPAGNNAKFGDIRATGAFLVSSAIENDVVQYLRVISEKGTPLTITNPWPSQNVQVYRDGVVAEVLDTPAEFSGIATAIGETLHFAPVGATFTQIQQKMAAPNAPKLFTGTGFENGQTPLTWVNSVDGANMVNMGPFCCGWAEPRIYVDANRKHTGAKSLLFAASATAGTEHSVYMKILDLHTGMAPITVGASTTLSYWVYPVSRAADSRVGTGNTSNCVALDVVFTDGTTLRDSASVDDTGDPATAVGQCGTLPLDTWSQVSINLGTKNAGKTIDRILADYNKPGVTGGFHSYFDDIVLGDAPLGNPPFTGTGFEIGQTPLTWTDSVDGSNKVNVGPFCCGWTGPRIYKDYHRFHTGANSLLFAASATAGTEHSVYMKILNLSNFANPSVVGASTTLSYWVYPVSRAADSRVGTGDTSNCVALDVVFTDGTTLRDSASVDDTGDPATAVGQCGTLPLDTWTQVSINLGTKNAGKTIDRILADYNKPGVTGGFHSYFDDIVLTP